MDPQLQELIAQVRKAKSMIAHWQGETHRLIESGVVDYQDDLDDLQGAENLLHRAETDLDCAIVRIEQAAWVLDL